MNDFCYQPNNLAVVTVRDTGERIEVYPGLFMVRTAQVVELTNGGRIFLRQMCADYTAGKLTVDEVLNNLQVIAEDFFPSEYDAVYDKFFAEFTNMMIS